MDHHTTIERAWWEGSGGGKGLKVTLAQNVLMQVEEKHAFKNITSKTDAFKSILERESHSK